ncbi:hypothetical protein [Methylacidimicrobium sp. B4]|uniref:hypothetical protein n=1 Tax=Methylacidimicrobium sp. B4 TaxID=2796139 RepID=UPI001A8E75A7|nr:hypothetical protein [Methylacidimicrobium sp. B4]QSR85563.1 hypothetical protein MacB4_04890 [Methylacidimicrobium sp. B4]
MTLSHKRHSSVDSIRSPLLPRIRLALVTLALPVIASLLPLGVAQPIAPPAGGPRHPTPAQQRQIQQMQEHLRKMVREQDDELERLISELHGASRDQKIDLLTRIVTRLIEQRRAFHQESESVRLRILDMQNPPAPLPRAPDTAAPAPAVEQPSSAQPADTPPPASDQGYVPQQPQ